MASFEAKIYRVTIETHPKADRLEIAKIGAYNCIVGKGEYRTGDLAAYVPEGSLCPDWLIQELGLEGRLAGAQKNRVKAVKLRGVLSQGLVYPVRAGRIRGQTVHLGDDVTELLELAKWEPPIPVSMSGAVMAAPRAALRYDIEDIKKYPEAFVEGQPVIMTEKIHGTWCCLGWHPACGAVVASKGIAEKGLIFQLDEANAKNLYVRTYGTYRAALEQAQTRLARPDEPFYVLGEVFGPGVQDLQYGLRTKGFALFDCYVGEPGQGRYVDAQALPELGDLFALAPVLYEGPFSQEKLQLHTNGATTFDARHVREGVVVKPVVETETPELRRLILKSVSEKYLMRKGGTEFN